MMVYIKHWETDGKFLLYFLVPSKVSELIVRVHFGRLEFLGFVLGRFFH
jgi:hypothetical protein